MSFKLGIRLATKLLCPPWRRKCAHQQVAHIYRLADAQFDRHTTRRVGLLASETSYFEVIYHVEQSILGGEAQVLALVLAVRATLMPVVAKKRRGAAIFGLVK